MLTRLIGAVLLLMLAGSAYGQRYRVNQDTVTYDTSFSGKLKAALLHKKNVIKANGHLHEHLISWSASYERKITTKLWIQFSGYADQFGTFTDDYDEGDLLDRQERTYTGFSADVELRFYLKYDEWGDDSLPKGFHIGPHFRFMRLKQRYTDYIIYPEEAVYLQYDREFSLPAYGLSLGYQYLSKGDWAFDLSVLLLSYGEYFGETTTDIREIAPDYPPGSPLQFRTEPYTGLIPEARLSVGYNF